MTLKDNRAPLTKVQKMDRPEPKTCGNHPVAGDLTELRRGIRSTVTDVRIPKDKPCILKRHFLGCLRQIVGLAEKLAANDQERFIWAGERAFLKNACKRNSKNSYSRRQVRYCLAIAESLGILTPAERVRRSVLRKGFIVEHHDSLARAEGTRCVLAARPSDKPPRLQGQKRHDVTKGKSASGISMSASASAPVASPNAQPISSADNTVCLTNCPSECLLPSPQAIEEADDQSSEVTIRPSNTAENGHSEPSQPVNPLKENPAKGNPADQHWILDGQLVTCSLAALDDLDLKRQPADDLIGDVCHELKRASDIGGLSDEEFDCTFLKSYQHTDELLWACDAALKELSDEPFEGRKSRARVMGLAMEYLRSGHKLDAPPGWLPAMKRLRTKSPELRSLLDKKTGRLLGPSTILFCIEFADTYGVVRKLTEQEPRLKELLISVAERIGTPNDHLELGWYLNAVMHCLRPIPAKILHVRNEADRWLRESKGGARHSGSYPMVAPPEGSLMASEPAVV